MPANLILSRVAGVLFGDGGSFDPWSLAWQPASAAPPHDASPVTPVEALTWLNGTGQARRVPVAVIGPREATRRQEELAHALGRRFAELGLTVLCGGKGGVMAAVCKGCREAGGLTIGLLPDDEWQGANDHVTIPLATGLGKARNAVIARAAIALVAVGGGYGTLSEMAFGLHFDRRVLALDTAPAVEGVIRCADVEEVARLVAARILGLD